MVKGGSGFLRGKGASSKPENRTGVNLGQKDDLGLDLLHLRNHTVEFINMKLRKEDKAIGMNSGVILDLVGDT